MSPAPPVTNYQLKLVQTPLKVDTMQPTTPSLQRSPFSPLSSVLRRSMLSASRLGPPQRVRTPTSSHLLQNELDITVDADMSLLISPSAMGNPNDVMRSPVNTSHFRTKQSVGEAIMAEAVAKSSSPEVELTIRGNGVQMDLSEMFSGIDSPAKGEKMMNGASIPTVYTHDLRKGVFVDFGDSNIVGQARSLPFVIEVSPGSLEDLSLEIERIPFTKGINLVVSDPTSASLKGLTPSVKQQKKLGGLAVPNLLTVKQGEKATLYVTWTPVTSGGIREIILLKLPRGPGRLRVTVLGHAREPKQVSVCLFVSLSFGSINRN